MNSKRLANFANHFSLYSSKYLIEYMEGLIDLQLDYKRSSLSSKIFILFFSVLFLVLAHNLATTPSFLTIALLLVCLVCLPFGFIHQRAANRAVDDLEELIEVIANELLTREQQRIQKP